MRTKRLKVDGAAIYHCMSRTVNGVPLFKHREKEVLRKMIHQISDFSGVEVLTYCLMNNHFHVLVKIPEPSEVSDHELMRRYRVLYPKPTTYQTATARLMEATLQKNDEEAAAIREKLLARMGDVSAFMKTLKQRFSTWFNKTHERYGPLWSDRFKSVLVEGKGNALQTMAAYIDLNPVRAGLVEDPKDYRFCGYAEAVAGRKLAIQSLKFVSAGLYDISNEEALQNYRHMLFGMGSALTEKKAYISRERAIQVLEKEDGRLPTAVLLRCRVRYFSEGAALGSAEFVRVHAERWKRISDRKKAVRPKFIVCSDADALTVMRNVRGQAFT